MTFSYDKEADVLYISFRPIVPHSYFYAESMHGDVLRLDRITKEIVGCTILGFSQRSSQGKIDIPEIGPVPFNEIAEGLLHA
jgi:uncharacterized protein YuzE